MAESLCHPHINSAGPAKCLGSHQVLFKMQHFHSQKSKQWTMNISRLMILGERDRQTYFLCVQCKQIQLNNFQLLHWWYPHTSYSSSLLCLTNVSQGNRGNNAIFKWHGCRLKWHSFRLHRLLMDYTFDWMNMHEYPRKHFWFCLIAEVRQLCQLVKLWVWDWVPNIIALMQYNLTALQSVNAAAHKTVAMVGSRNRRTMIKYINFHLQPVCLG